MHTPLRQQFTQFGVVRTDIDISYNAITENEADGWFSVSSKGTTDHYMKESMIMQGAEIARLDETWY